MSNTVLLKQCLRGTKGSVGMEQVLGQTESCRGYSAKWVLQQMRRPQKGCKMTWRICSSQQLPQHLPNLRIFVTPACCILEVAYRLVCFAWVVRV